MVKHTKKLLVQSLKVLLSVGIIIWLVQSDKLNFAALKNLLSPGVAFLAISLVLFNLFLASERWRVLINSQSLKTSRWPVFKLTLIGSFFNFAMPGGVGGDVIKAFYFTRENPGTKVIAVTSVLIDRVMGLFAMVLMALFVMILDLQHIRATPLLQTLFYFIMIVTLIFVMTLGLIFSKKLYQSGRLYKLIEPLPMSQRFIKVYESLHLYGRDKARMISVLSLSLVAQISTIVFLYIAGITAGYTDIPLKTYFLVAPLGFMATAIPISPAGVGVGQAAFYFLFNLYTGHESELGPTTITAYQVTSFVVSLLGAYFYMRRRDRVQSSLIEEIQ